ncbi:MAG TPA: nuclear transport factor 2 family protein [Acidimicrobiales bacterium]|nr:nuclear transport factor 2 family protein [Acidimicrobiales bacterium]
MHSSDRPGPHDTTPMARCLSQWHRVLASDRDALADLLADEAVLHSPIVFTPQRGKDLVLLYLTGAMMTFGGDADHAATGGTSVAAPPPESRASGGREGSAADTWDGRFRYVRTVTGSHDAVLEFETTMRGTYVNGVDMIRCNDEGRIVDFKVMIRPLRAVNTVHELMAAALEQLQGRD